MMIKTSPLRRIRSGVGVRKSDENQFRGKETQGDFYSPGEG
jgi:hypothetical protein